MQIKAFFMGKPGEEKALPGIAEEFKKTARLYGAEPEYRILSEEDGRLIAGIKAELNFQHVSEENRGELFETLLRRMRILGVMGGLIPLDDEGRIIWLQPGYGFEVIFHSPQKGRADDLYAIAKTVYDEVGEHMEDGQVGALGDDGQGGEFYRVQLAMQDYLRQNARKRLMLAAYFRLLLLARQGGFEVVIPPENRED